jgi:hypothetical protein
MQAPDGAVVAQRNAHLVAPVDEAKNRLQQVVAVGAAADNA